MAFEKALLPPGPVFTSASAVRLPPEDTQFFREVWWTEKVQWGRKERERIAYIAIQQCPAVLSRDWSLKVSQILIHQVSQVQNKQKQTQSIGLRNHSIRRSRQFEEVQTKHINML